VLFKQHQGRFQFIGNPLDTVKALYHYLALDQHGGRAAAETIWDHDQAILDRASEFYAALASKLGTNDWTKLQSTLASSAVPAGFTPELWASCQASHRGFQLGTEILLLPAVIAQAAEFDQIRVDEKLEPVFPARFTDAKGRDALHKALAPAPIASSDEIVTPMGGHFYGREAPHLPPLATEGMHFTAGQPLFVIEVMKMFNKISVPFSGTITKLIMGSADAKIVSKGQPIFKIEPDHKQVVESPEDVAARRRALTNKLLEKF
jgi:biotin carboxyl carrier protein